VPASSYIKIFVIFKGRLVEPIGIEPTTSTMPL
jgi:hypothetical protein